MSNKLIYPKTVEQACEQLGYDPKKVVSAMDFYPEKDRDALISISKRMIVTDAINRVDNNGKEWFPDWGNYNERKYQPWFDMGGSSGSGFSYFVYDLWFSTSFCGSRLCFKTLKGMEHAIEYFGDLFETEFLKSR